MIAKLHVTHILCKRLLSQNRMQGTVLLVAATFLFFGCSRMGFSRNTGSPGEQVQLAVLEDILGKDSNTESTNGFAAYYIDTSSNTWSFVSKAWAGHRVPIKPYNQCYVAKDSSVKDKQTNKNGEIINLAQVKFVSADHAQCWISYYCGNLGSGVFIYELTRKNGKWSVIKINTLCES